MNSRWGDDIDEELQNKKKLTVGFMWNFISMNNMITQIDQEVGETEGNYPKSEFMKIWASALVIILILAVCSHSILVIATLPFMFFYGLLLFKIAGGLKRFGYSLKSYWLLTVLALIAVAGIAALAQTLIFGK